MSNTPHGTLVASIIGKADPDGLIYTMASLRETLDNMPDEDSLDSWPANAWKPKPLYEVVEMLSEIRAAEWYTGWMIGRFSTQYEIPAHITKHKLDANHDISFNDYCPFGMFIMPAPGRGPALDREAKLPLSHGNKWRDLVNDTNISKFKAIGGAIVPWHAVWDSFFGYERFVAMLLLSI